MFFEDIFDIDTVDMFAIIGATTEEQEQETENNTDKDKRKEGS